MAPIVEANAQPCVRRTRLRHAPPVAVSGQGTFASVVVGQTRRAADAIVSPLKLFNTVILFVRFRRRSKKRIGVKKMKERLLKQAKREYSPGKRIIALLIEGTFFVGILPVALVYFFFPA